MKAWSKSWKSSKKARKQRKYRFNAPLHIKRKLASSHLSKELKQKYNRRSVVVNKGDKVKIARGQFKGSVGKIEEVNTKNSKIFVSGIEVQKKDGSKTRVPIHSSNVIITEVNLEDKKRNMKLNKEKKA